MASRSTPPPVTDALPLHLELVSLATLKPHPRNYRTHPDDQLAHLQESLQTHGVYRNVVIARDGTLLAGHGVVEAARQLGMTEIPVVRLALDPQEERALQILVGDNEIARLSLANDRALTELLKELHDFDMTALLGTGFDASMLAGLALVTRPASEIADKNEAAQWVGMPEYGEPAETLRVVVRFRNAQDRAVFAEKLGIEFTDTTRTVISLWYPEKTPEDVAALAFEG